MTHRVTRTFTECSTGGEGRPVLFITEKQTGREFHESRGRGDRTIPAARPIASNPRPAVAAFARSSEAVRAWNRIQRQASRYQANALPLTGRMHEEKGSPGKCSRPTAGTRRIGITSLGFEQIRHSNVQFLHPGTETILVDLSLPRIEFAPPCAASPERRAPRGAPDFRRCS